MDIRYAVALFFLCLMLFMNTLGTVDTLVVKMNIRVGEMNENSTVVCTCNADFMAALLYSDVTIHTICYNTRITKLVDNMSCVTPVLWIPDFTRLYKNIVYRLLD